jgi:hypothetical protein
MQLAERSEAARDQAENAFTAILRRVFRAVPALLSAVFVDVEGECIDYVAAIDPYEAKVCAAHMHMLLGALRRMRLTPLSGDPYALEVVTSEREVWVRRVGEDYVIVALLAHGFDRSELRDALARAGREFRDEVGIATPSWEASARLSVRLRASAGWTYAPAGFSLDGERHAIAAVLGRWTEWTRQDAPRLVCFRVRTQEGQELTLAHDELTEVWRMRRD